MTTTPTSSYRGSVLIHPTTDLQLAPRQLDEFIVRSVSPKQLEAESTHPDAPDRFLRELPQHLELLSWDMVWECLVAVQFEPASGRRDEQRDGNKCVTMYLHDTINASCGNPRHGLADQSQFGLLQSIRDRIVAVHLAAGDTQREQLLRGDAALLIAIEHFVKGVVSTRYALPEFYSAVETIENRLSSRKSMIAALGLSKADVDLITRWANDPQYDQRHGPVNAAAVAPVPQEKLTEAAKMAREIIARYSQTIV